VVKSTSGRRVRTGLAALTGAAAVGVATWWAVAGRPVDPSAASAAEIPAEVADVAGFTKIATTQHHIVVVNVLPAEHMYTPEELAAQHPTEGEAVLDGPANPVVPNARHIEAHIYDRTTGLPSTAITPTIAVTVVDTGERTEIPPTLMQDVVIGAPDRHFGNNVVVQGGHDVSVQVDIGGEEVVIDGHLD
jgi:hypothetical protein